MFDFSQFHFADIRWFWGVLIIPIVGLLYFFFYRSNTKIDKLEKFADKNLIPHLLKNSKAGEISVFWSVTIASLLWLLFMAAMAGPRWSFKEITNFTQDKTLVILLDLSKSMDADDVKPSRLFRARQEIEDIMNLNKDIRIGLIGFAANTHVISAITDDMTNIKQILPFISTDLVYVQGTRISQALKTAEQMLNFERGDNKSILIITDGGITDIETLDLVSSIAEKNIIIHTLGIGTEEGVRLNDVNGKLIERNGHPLMSRLEKNALQLLSAKGNGKYFDSDYTDKNTKEILSQINLRNNFLEKDGIALGGKQWEDKFYIFLFPLMLIILFWFRKGFAFPILLVVILAYSQSAQATSITDQLFLSKEQMAKKALEEIEDFDTAIKLFDDPYKRGIAYYKAGNFAEAEKYFRNNNIRPEVQNRALYNLGNALAMQNKLNDAIIAYEEALKADPNNPKIKNNLGIVKVMIIENQKKEKEENKEKKPKSKENDFPGGGSGSSDDEGDDDEDGDGGESKDKSDENSNDDQDKCNDDNCNKKKGKEDREQNHEKENNRGSSQQDQQQGAQGQQIGADQWLDQIQSDYKNFLKNQFYLESQKQNSQTQSIIDPW